MKVKHAVFVPGDWVYYYNPRRFTGKSEKWSRKYIGPMVIVKRLGPVNYLIQKSRNSLPFVAHIDKLKRCYNRDTANWAVEVVKQSAVETGLSVTTDRPGQTEIDHTGPTASDIPVINSLPEEIVVQSHVADVIDAGDKLERPRRDIRLPVRYRH